MEYRLWSLMSRFDCFQHLDLTTINCDRLRKRRTDVVSLSDKELETLAKILEEATNLPLYMNENRGISVSGIASAARQIQAKEGRLGL